MFSIGRNRWVHCDPCENACDTPLMYETGWKKKLTYVMAYSAEEIQDVTWRYSSDHKLILTRRKNCTENQLLDAIISLRTERQKDFPLSRNNYLTKRLLIELVELMVEKKPTEGEFQGRISGSQSWRSARGEIGCENLYFWKFDNDDIVNNRLTVRYSASSDAYQFERGDGVVKVVKGWDSGILSYENVFRKEELDWKTVYLTRNGRRI